MSMPTNGGGPAMPPSPPAGAPQLNILAQYVKDFSFENPQAPKMLNSPVQPQIQIQINVQANPISGTDFEVELRLEGKAEATGSVMFSFELVYAGLFRLQNIPQEQLHPIVLIECPRLLFPFAREIIATNVRHGGFPPLLLDPIDFVQLYQQRMAQTGAPGAQPPAA